MDIEFLKLDCGSIGGQRRAIAQLRDEVRDLITSVGATTFGVVPLDIDGRTLALGCVPDIHPDCRDALESALGRPVTLIPFDESVVREAINHYYAQPKADGSTGIDLPTFDNGDFLLQPACVRKLMLEKDGVLPERKIVVPPGHIALIDLRVHSVMKSLDRARRVDFSPSASAIPFKVIGDEAILYRERMPGAKTRAIVAESLFYDGDEHMHGLRGEDITELPHVLHPSELQLAELDGNEARFWVYDRLQTVRTSAPRGPRGIASWSCSYHFLHYGARFVRNLQLDVLSFSLVKRTRLRIARRSDRLVPSDLQRIFGLDFSRSGVADGTP